MKQNRVNKRQQYLEWFGPRPTSTTLIIQPRLFSTNPLRTCEIHKLSPSLQWLLPGSAKTFYTRCDILIVSSNSQAKNEVKQYLRSKFKLKDLGASKYFLSIEIARSPKGILLCQRKYALDLIEKHGLLGSKLTSTLMDYNHELTTTIKNDLLAYDFGFTHSDTVELCCDNQFALSTSKIPMFHEIRKHIEVDCHFVREKVIKGFIKPSYIQTSLQLANLFTKVLLPGQFQFLLSKMSIPNVHAHNTHLKRDKSYQSTDQFQVKILLRNLDGVKNWT
ncbi:Reverse transcriptase [Theobroma cacao]|nr:Reverse transcriptase [Theobroma cacao]